MCTNLAIRKYISCASPAKAARHAQDTREGLMRQAQEAYAKASKAGGSNLASATSKMAQATGAAKDSTFEKWSRAELKGYLDSFGVPVYQGSNMNELRHAARRSARYFKYGSDTPHSAIYHSILDTLDWLIDKSRLGALLGREKGYQSADHAKQRAEGFARSEL